MYETFLVQSRVTSDFYGSFGIKQHSLFRCSIYLTSLVRQSRQISVRDLQAGPPYHTSMPDIFHLGLGCCSNLLKVDYQIVTRDVLSSTRRQAFVYQPISEV